MNLRVTIPELLYPKAHMDNYERQCSVDLVLSVKHVSSVQCKVVTEVSRVKVSPKTCKKCVKMCSADEIKREK